MDATPALLNRPVPRFELLSLLGVGAEGIVLLARDREDADAAPVALKVLVRPADTEPAALIRLQDEARVLAWLDHPAIARVHRLLEKDGWPIVVMEHLPGASAMELLGGTPAGLPAAVAVAIALGAATALEAAYDAPGPDGLPMRIVHRDIKPANLLVTLAGAVKLVDFGIAAGSFETPQAGDPEIRGTRGYVAPERRNGGADTPAVDVYALGTTLFGLLSGKVLVQSPTAPLHDPAIARALGYLTGEGLAPEDAEALRGLIADMCRFAPARRPAWSEVRARLVALAARLGAVDLATYADARVRPIDTGRAALYPPTHPAWEDLKFLADAGPVHDLDVRTPGPARELALRRVYGPREPGPLLAALQPRPAWAFWAPASDPRAVVGALVALRGTRDPRAVSRAYELTSDGNARVSEAAWALLAAAC